MRQLFTILILVATARLAHAGDPPIPAAQKAKLDKLGPIQTPVVYLAATAKVPARWLVFVGPQGGAAISAWLVTPNADPKLELNRVTQWPNAMRVVAATTAVVPSTRANTPPSTSAILSVESMEAPELGQPAGLRTLLAVEIPDDIKGATDATPSLDAIPFLADAKDLSDQATRFAAFAKFGAEDTTDKLFADDAKLAKALDAAKKSDKALAKLIPSGGIAVYDAWQSLFARDAGKIAKLDKSPAVKTLRAALADNTYCLGHVCGSLVVGAESGKLVIRAVFATPPGKPATAPRRAVTANAKDTQTMATAAMVQTPSPMGKFRGEAPLGTATGTIGVVGDTLIVRDGGFVATMDLIGENADLRFGDYDGDGLTDVLAFKDGASQFVLSSAAYNYSGEGAFYEMTVIGAPTADAAAAATLGVADDALKTKEACGVLAKVTNAKTLASVLAPGGMVFGYEEPSQPARSAITKLEGKDAVQVVKGKCPIERCSDRLPVCKSVTDGPGTDYYMFTRVKGKLMLFRAASYRGA